MAQISAFFYRDYEQIDADAEKKHLKSAALEPLRLLRSALAALQDWSPDELHQVVKDVADTLGLKLGKVAQPLRVAVVGRAASPGIDITLYLVGREACLRRIDRVLVAINDRAQGDDA
jgi:glutamyl-tRNA synthetase